MRCVEVRRVLHIVRWTIRAYGILAPLVCRPHCTFRIGQTSAVARHDTRIAKQKQVSKQHEVTAPKGLLWCTGLISTFIMGIDNRGLASPSFSGPKGASAKSRSIVRLPQYDENLVTKGKRVEAKPP